MHFFRFPYFIFISIFLLKENMWKFSAHVSSILLSEGDIKIVILYRSFFNLCLRLKHIINRKISEWEMKRKKNLPRNAELFQKFTIEMVSLTKHEPNRQNVLIDLRVKLTDSSKLIRFQPKIIIELYFLITWSWLWARCSCEFNTPWSCLRMSCWVNSWRRWNK
jgi:hypothetical protein